MIILNKKASSLNTNRRQEVKFLLVKETMQLLSGKWKMQVIMLLLRDGRTRFNELQRGLAGITAKTLSKELQLLEDNKIISRRVLESKLISVEYDLTKRGKELNLIISAIIHWSNKHKKTSIT